MSELRMIFYTDHACILWCYSLPPESCEVLVASHIGVTRDSQATSSSALSEHHSVARTVSRLRGACAGSSLHSVPCHLGHNLLVPPDSIQNTHKSEHIFGFALLCYSESIIWIHDKEKWLTLWSGESFLRSQHTQLINNSLNFTEPKKGSLPCLQKSANASFPQPYKFSPCPLPPYLLNIILPSIPWSSKWSLPFRFADQNSIPIGEN
jgi:hypothetical protein